MKSDISVCGQHRVFFGGDIPKRKAVIQKEIQKRGGDYMATTFPGTTVEITKYEKGASKALFDGVFAAGGITLSQLCIMTGLEPYLVQNWVKRGFVSSPKNRVYSRQQFARVVIINMLRESLQIEKICNLIKVIGGEPDDTSDDLICDEELYHRYVDMLSYVELNFSDRQVVRSAAERAAEDFSGDGADGKRKLVSILEVMLFAHTAARLRETAEEIILMM